MEEKLDVLNERGEFTGKVATREECHRKGLWPSKWDVTVGGHVDAGEFGKQTIIRECKEELGIDVKESEIKYLISSTSVYEKNNYSNRHYDECYLIMKDIDIKKLKLQKEEVSDVQYFSKDELLQRIDNDYDGLTEKTGSWHFLKRLLENGTIN